MLAEEGGRKSEVGMRNYNRQLNATLAPEIPGQRIHASFLFYCLQLPSVEH